MYMYIYLYNNIYIYIYIYIIIIIITRPQIADTKETCLGNPETLARSPAAGSAAG